VGFNGKEHMSWQLSSSGFLMKLSGYVPELIEQDFNRFLQNALKNADLNEDEISHWCIHPGGKRILSSIAKCTSVSDDDLQYSYRVLNDYGNMSSPTILFVLKEIVDSLENKKEKHANIFGAAFGPGLTMETFILSDD
jgi:predicted naringenin-chalcone synthase